MDGTDPFCVQSGVRVKREHFGGLSFVATENTQTKDA
jgi:hypothetical protein